MFIEHEWCSGSKEDSRARPEVRLDQGSIGPEIFGEMCSRVRKAEQVKAIREESMEVGLKLNIGKTVSIVECHAELIRSLWKTDRKVLVQRKQGVI